MDESPPTDLDRRSLLRLVGTFGAVATAGCMSIVSNPQESVPANSGEQGDLSTLTVHVETDEGDPVSEAMVFVTVGDSPQWVPGIDSKTPNINGVVRFKIEDGEYTVRTRSEEYSEGEVPVTVSGDTEVTVTVKPGVELPTDELIR